jgi:hypothetical protein
MCERKNFALINLGRTLRRFYQGHAAREEMLFKPDDGDNTV